MSLPPVVARVTADTRGLTKGLADAQTRLATFAKIGGAAAGAVAVGLVALTKASLANIDALTKQARSLGLTTAAFQKMTLVAREAGVESGQLSQMLGLMQRAAESGSKAFGKLGLSIEDIQGLAPDEQFARIAEALDKIEDPAAKTNLAMEVFGRSGRAAINMLSDYRQKVDEAARFQERFGIAVTQAGAEKVERANDAVGRLGQVFVGLGNTLAVKVAPAIEKTANALLRLMEIMARLAEGVPDALDAIDAEVFVAVSKAVSTAIPALDIFAMQLRQIGETEAAAEISDLVDELEKADEKFAAGAITGEQFRAKVEEINGKAEALVKSLKGVNASTFSAVVAQLGILSGALRDAAKEAAILRNELPSDLAPSDGSSIDPPFTPSSGPNVRPNNRTNPVLRDIDFEDPSETGAGGGRGGGLRSQLQARLEALTESLRTEAEIIAEWNAESMAILNDALAAKRLTEEEYMHWRERLEQEHQDRLNSIRQMAGEGAMSIVLGTGQEILSALGQTNEKALRIAKVFGAAQALISTYQGAAEALKLPFPKNLAAAGAVLARGLAFVSAIKGVNKGGGAAGGGGGASGGSAAPAAPVQTLNFTITNDPFGFGERVIRQLAGQINEATRNGSSIRATVAT